jgi:hypothetical protein
MNLELILWIVIFSAAIFFASITLMRNAPNAERQDLKDEQKDANAEIEDDAEVEDYEYKSQDYQVALTFASLISIVGWIVFVVGIVAAFVSVAQIATITYGNNLEIKLIAMLPGLGISMAGLLFIMIGQIARATVDSANNTKEILEIMKNK